MRKPAGALAGHIWQGGHPLGLPLLRAQPVLQRTTEGREKGYSCASNEDSYAGHIWDRRDAQGCMGATACIVIPWFADRYAQGQDWRSLAWWIHDHLPYSALFFFPRLAALNITWHENPERRISSYIKPRGILTKPGMDNHGGDHSVFYEGFPALRQS